VRWSGTTCPVVDGAAGDVRDERSEFDRDGDWREHLAYGGIYASGGSVCGVVLAWDISGEYCALGIACGAVYALENLVAGFVSATASPPPFDNPAIVSEYLEINAGGARAKDCAYKELESDTFGPSNVPVLSFPTWEQLPGSPPPVDVDSDPVTRASVRISMEVVCKAATWDGACEVLGAEGRPPPVQVFGCFARGGTG